MAKKIIGGICLFLGIAGFLVLFIEKSMEALPAAIIFAIIGILLLLIKGKSKQEKMQLREQGEANVAQYKRTVNCKHTAGLPLADGTTCGVEFGDEEILISGGGNDFKLPYNRITNLQVKTDVEIQKAYTSSIGGAVGGAVLFGPLGAIIGGRTKEKTSKVVEHYLIITYTKDDKIEYLSFWTSENFKAAKLIDQKRGLLSSQNMTVNL